MKLVKIIPKSQRAKSRVKEHGKEMELLVDNGDKFMVRSLENTFTHKNDVMGKWLGWFTKEEAEYD